MEEKDEKKKKKLTLSISSKKSFSAPHYKRDKQKKTIEGQYEDIDDDK